MNLEVINHVKSELVGIESSKGLLKQLLKRFRSHPRVKKAKRTRDGTIIRVVFVGGAMARKLNRDFRKKRYTPDVLSFEAPEGLGEVVLCVPVIKKDARKHGLSFFKQRDYLLIHGFLHLLGYDHQNPKDEKVMMGIQDQLFERLSLLKGVKGHGRKRRRTTHKTRARKAAR